MGKILVIGSSNTDLIVKVDQFPAPGETIEGKLFLQAMGGKGANQAVAAHRAGGCVEFVTSLGDDLNGRNALKYFKEEGLQTSLSLTIKDVASGTAMILVNKDGENCIVITPGANNEIKPEYIDEIESKIRDAVIVLVQMEIPLATVRRICQLAVKNNVQVMLNVAPAREINDALITMVDILILNEIEIENVTGMKIQDVGEEIIMDSLLLRGAKTVILTLGKAGCRIKSADINEFIPSFNVNVIDTTGAGDTFCGAIAAKLSKGMGLVDSCKFATAAAAVCITRMGAQSSIPKEIEVRDFLAEQRFSDKNFELID